MDNDWTSHNTDSARSDTPLSARARHDLNNLLGPLMGGLQLMAMRHKGDERDQYLITNALNSVSHIQSFFDNLGHSRADAVAEGGFERGHRNPSGHPAIMDGADRHDLFFAAIEMTRMPMIVTDPNQPDNPIVFANQAFLNTTGYEMEEIVGHNCRFLQGEGTDPDVVANLRRAIRDRTDIAVEVQNYRKDGTMFWNALFVSPIFDREGKLLYFFGSQLDITRRREAETALRRAQKMEAIGQLTGGIAHDFNNLLQVIIGNLQMARSVSDQADKLSRHHDAVLLAAQKARSLTQQLLAFSRKQALEARIVNLNRIITELKDLLSRTLGSHIDIRLDLDPGLANARLDIIQLEMALINILANTRDAMPEGGSVTIKTFNMTVDDAKVDSVSGGLRRGRYVGLAITDTGSGMAPDVLGRITEPFFTTKEVGKGTGLGLAQVYGFVKQSDGGFQADSVEGHGTTLKLLFPANGEVVDAPLAKASDEGARTLGKGELILVVEDNKEVRELACDILVQEGYEVIAAENAHQALKVLADKDGALDMLFTDIIMPGNMNGVALAKMVRKSHPNIAVLITTGFADDVHGHTNSSEFETLHKPYMPDELARKVRGVLNRKGDHRS